MRQNDALHSRPDIAHLLKESQIFIDGTVRMGNHNPKRSRPQSLQRIGIPRRILNRKIRGRKRIANRAAHVVLISNYQDPAHRLLQSDDLIPSCDDPMQESNRGSLLNR